MREGLMIGAGKEGGVRPRQKARAQREKDQRTAAACRSGFGVFPFSFFLFSCCLALAFLPAMAAAQRLNPNERAAPPLTNVEDKDDIHKPDSKIWVLDFKFYDPRLITVDIPGSGRKI